MGKWGCVTTLRVVWIEIGILLDAAATQAVTTLRVVWIEIFIASADEITSMSPPCGWCGLKFTWKSWLPETKASPPCGWCGLKYQEHGGVPKYLCHHLAGGVD